jgi:hypothetical protein
MIIFCPKCNKLNQVKGTAVDDKTIVRCRSCGYAFPLHERPKEVVRGDTTKVMKMQPATGEDAVSPETRADLLAWARRSAQEVDHTGPLAIMVDARTDDRFLLWKFRTYIGRSACDINLDDPDVSRQHAVIEKYGAKHLLKDLHSTNGTFLNGQAASMDLLKDADAVRFGRTILRFYSFPEEGGLVDARSA